MAASFVPITSIPQDAHPKDVPYLLGTLAPTDSILFTKQTLINFLKQQGIEVGPNCSELSRLPKYATFGKIVQAPLVQASSTPAEAPPAQATADVPASATVAAEQNSKPQGSMQSGSQNDPVPENAVRNAQGEAFRPTRRVREAIGGGSAQISALFGDDAEPSSGPLRNRSNESQSAASSMPAAQQPHRAATSAKNPSSVATPVFTPSVGVTDSEGKDFRPTRRVREPIGGGSAQIASLFGGDDSENDVPRRSTQRQGRGAFIVIEGLDRAGKSTQVARLSEALAGNGAATVLKFPDRTTPIGKLLNSYLADSSTKLDDRAVHLLFAANRWEVAERIRREVLEEGKVVIADRYAWSGVAYSRAKGMPLPWLLSPEVGLPSPDVTLFLSLSPEIAAQRGGYGEERYEKEEMQTKVRAAFKEVSIMVQDKMGSTRWKEIDAGRDREEVWKDVWGQVQSIVSATSRGAPVLEGLAF